MALSPQDEKEIRLKALDLKSKEIERKERESIRKDETARYKIEEESKVKNRALDIKQQQAKAKAKKNQASFDYSALIKKIFLKKNGNIDPGRAKIALMVTAICVIGSLFSASLDNRSSEEFNRDLIEMNRSVNNRY